MSEPRLSAAAAERGAAPRKPWSTPTLATLATGAAELNIGALDDGVDLS